MSYCGGDRRRNRSTPGGPSGRLAQKGSEGGRKDASSPLLGFHQRHGDGLESLPDDIKTLKAAGSARGSCGARAQQSMKARIAH